MSVPTCAAQSEVSAGDDVYRPRYPELKGELLLFSQGLPDLEALLARHQFTHPAKIQRASRE
jgi:hypothetical protein